MKKILQIMLLCLLITILLPYLIVRFFPQKEEILPEPLTTISVYIAAEDRILEMDTGQYLKEVVSAEMPAQFHPEALKAQAVAARTYLTNRVNVARSTQPPAEHKGADICTNPTHCKAWICEADRKALWQEDKRDEYWKKISDAVDETAGVLITYENQPISAVFHSTSSGFTENAKDVWGGDVPYLVSVESKGEELSPRYRSERVLTEAEFKQIAEQTLNAPDWSKGLFSDIVRSDAGGILSISIGGIPVKGTDFRTMFELRSTNVTPVFENGTVTLSVTGFGHGVGMSQYGANYLASQGMGYVDILKTYYTGVCVG